MSTVRRPATDAERRALASGVRLRILRICLDESRTNLEIAERLGRNPATTLHHVRTLVDAGFLVAEPARRGTRGSREIPYRATGLSWRLDIDAGRGPDVAAMLEAFVGEVSDADPEKMITSRLGLRLRPAELEELADRLQDVLDEFAARPRSPDGEPFSVFLAIHPDTDRA
ncbi:MAG TPA: helix-turn-helix domain-containing protein [Kineosporiaceae bacterium]|jgi:predicted ArsR family transcriptional regulator|nr:helix-turn-helix domain-containing protein [Kineosporiaceae bacterium]